MTMRLRTRTGLAAAALAVLTVSPVHGADSQGNYAVLGAGSFACERFIASAESQSSQEINQFMSWMQGYLTALNRERDGIFSVSPFVSASDTAAMLLNVCRQQPELRLENALRELADFLAGYRIEQASEVAQIASGDATVAVRASVLGDVRQRLAALGHDVGDGDALFDDQLQQALREFQREQGLTESGVPDADTLLRLFYQ